MVTQFHTTPSGQLVRALSSSRFFRYPDELDPSLWKKYVPRNTTSLASLSGEQTDKPSSEPNMPAIAFQNLDCVVDDGQNILLVDWYGSDDPENPQNWPNTWKYIIAFQMCILSFSIYIASSIYVPGEASIMEEFGVSETVATLGLSLFTLGYGTGPMLWSPMSEMPKLGRSGIFFWTLLGFVVFQLAVGFAPNMPVFLVFRYVTGFLGSPCLATGGGTISDIFHPMVVVNMLCIWSSAGICGPVFGPIIGGYLAPAKGWRWTIWVFTWMCTLVLIVMFFFFPETSAANILYRRARRLRKATGDNRLRSQSEIDAAHHTSKDHLTILARAFTLTFFEPIVLLMDLYAGLVYGVLFIWFESFPIVFGEIYRFNTGQQGLVFISIFVFAVIAIPLFLLWVRVSLVPKMAKSTFKPEMVLPPTFAGSLALPICLFWYGWTSREDIHWIVPVIGSGLFSVGVVTLFNSLFNYLGITYAQYAASAFAGSALFRAIFGTVFPLFARSLFQHLGIGPGNSLLGALAVCFLPIPFVFYRYGNKVRHMSKNARHDM
ncbi:MFS general substrate transporter [Whalleya microplaca]|nr:MFS general substrate transporter [Whalleya microplaca]